MDVKQKKVTYQQEKRGASHYCIVIVPPFIIGQPYDYLHPSNLPIKTFVCATATKKD